MGVGIDFAPITGRFEALDYDDWSLAKAEQELAKADIREMARRMGLPNWDQPAAACLATRIPYGTPITAEALSRIAAAESVLKQIGLSQVRVRHHPPVARVEVEPGDFQTALAHRLRIVEKLKALGYVYVALDLAGFRSGSMNEGITSNGSGEPPPPAD